MIPGLQELLKEEKKAEQRVWEVKEEAERILLEVRKKAEEIVKKAEAVAGRDWEDRCSGP